jgi:hypothetical protein
MALFRKTDFFTLKSEKRSIAALTDAQNLCVQLRKSSLGKSFWIRRSQSFPTSRHLPVLPARRGVMWPVSNVVMFPIDSILNNVCN